MYYRTSSVSVLYEVVIAIGDLISRCPTGLRGKAIEWMPVLIDATVHEKTKVRARALDVCSSILECSLTSGLPVKDANIVGDSLNSLCLLSIHVIVPQQPFSRAVFKDEGKCLRTVKHVYETFKVR